MRRSTQDLREQLDSGFMVYLIDYNVEKIVVYKISLINSDFPRTFINQINEDSSSDTFLWTFVSKTLRNVL